MGDQQRPENKTVGVNRHIFNMYLSTLHYKVVYKNIVIHIWTQRSTVLSLSNQHD